jgi:hypothetical protein
VPGEHRGPGDPGARPPRTLGPPGMKRTLPSRSR